MYKVQNCAAEDQICGGVFSRSILAAVLKFTLYFKLQPNSALTKISLKQIIKMNQYYHEPQ